MNKRSKKRSSEINQNSPKKSQPFIPENPVLANFYTAISAFLNNISNEEPTASFNDAFIEIIKDTGRVLQHDPASLTAAALDAKWLKLSNQIQFVVQQINHRNQSSQILQRITAIKDTVVSVNNAVPIASAAKKEHHSLYLLIKKAVSQVEQSAEVNDEDRVAIQLRKFKNDLSHNYTKFFQLSSLDRASSINALQECRKNTDQILRILAGTNQVVILPIEFRNFTRFINELKVKSDIKRPSIPVRSKTPPARVQKQQIIIQRNNPNHQCTSTNASTTNNTSNMICVSSSTSKGPLQNGQKSPAGKSLKLNQSNLTKSSTVRSKTPPSRLTSTLSARSNAIRPKQKFSKNTNFSTTNSSIISATSNNSVQKTERSDKIERIDRNDDILSPRRTKLPRSDSLSKPLTKIPPSRSPRSSLLSTRTSNLKKNSINSISSPSKTHTPKKSSSSNHHATTSTSNHNISNTPTNISHINANRSNTNTDSSSVSNTNINISVNGSSGSNGGSESSNQKKNDATKTETSNLVSTVVNIHHIVPKSGNSSILSSTPSLQSIQSFDSETDQLVMAVTKAKAQAREKSPTLEKLQHELSGGDFLLSRDEPPTLKHKSLDDPLSKSFDKSSNGDPKETIEEIYEKFHEKLKKYDFLVSTHENIENFLSKCRKSSTKQSLLEFELSNFHECIASLYVSQNDDSNFLKFGHSLARLSKEIENSFDGKVQYETLPEFYSNVEKITSNLQSSNSDVQRTLENYQTNFSNCKKTLMKYVFKQSKKTDMKNFEHENFQLSQEIDRLSKELKNISNSHQKLQNSAKHESLERFVKNDELTDVDLEELNSFELLFLQEKLKSQLSSLVEEKEQEITEIKLHQEELYDKQVNLRKELQEIQQEVQDIYTTLSKSKKSITVEYHFQIINKEELQSILVELFRRESKILQTLSSFP
ncbi:hypothetical protein TRFO_35842 [Tritrichomonas foetus]|uniref:Uncharacterized protein n=1 Tax=Tritrichomonas foetus TaxID=1144522 RepID=A0A1J4JJZ3_9EUKA|nr:hypothetical protein TRFO_35842 [Tritrichomonas foetus]|eukprot:OHS97877.1 hypothetical protein TRFO_35842 [Tritrichomonas foetus]